MLYAAINEAGELVGVSVERQDSFTIPIDDQFYFSVAHVSIVRNGNEWTTRPLPPDHLHVWDGNVWIVSETLVAEDVKTIRKNLLQQSDWTQLPDVPLATKEAWATYRQALRDITSQPGYPTDITWPTPPTDN